MPNPLHPCVVHFPIAFFILGTVLAFFSICFFRKTLIITTALIFLLGTATMHFTMETGEVAEDQLLSLYPQEKDPIATHHHAAHWAYYFGIAATILAFASIFSGTDTRLNKTFRVLTCICAIVLSALIYVTAKRGGHIVYQDLLKITSNPIEEPTPITEEKED